MKNKLFRMIALFMCVTMLAGTVGCAKPIDQPEKKATPSLSAVEKGSGVVTKEEIVIAMNNDISALDPMKCWQVAAYYFYWTVYERLIKYNATTGEYEPELAESWKVSDDGLVYTFYLQKGVQWHDGSDFTAKDVKYTIERGIAEGTGNYPGVDHVVIVDDYTVDVVMSAPDSVFMDKQWTGDCCIIKDGSGDQLSLNPIGTGPFKFVEWISGDHITIEAFDGYWREQSGTKQITFRIIPEANARLIALQTGEIDISPIDSVGVSYITDDAGLMLLSTTSISVNYMGFNCLSGPFSNELVRKACSHAINRDAIVMAQLEGQGTVLKSFVGQGKMGYYDGFEGYEYNVAKAQSLMEEAGYADGFKCELSIRNGAEIASQLIQADLAAIGITVKINQMEAAAFTEYVSNGNTQLFIMSRSGGSADSYVSMFHSEAFGLDGNRMFYANDEMDALLAESHATLDMTARNEVYRKIQENINEHAPVLPLYAPTIFLGANSNIKDLAADSEGCHDYRNVYYGE